jgi:23S rRNA (cytidine1920-2'-O)/16S rRNA (cytidine1409-2'-O)-methyltransferase
VKIRLDKLLVERLLAPDMDTARAMIGAGEVYVNDTLQDKSGREFSLDVSVRLKEKCRYVSRGGVKLERGLNHFQVKVQGSCCLDVGASSGGFTDCLLQHGAEKVFAVDVAYGQLDWKIRQDERVVVIERFNARKLLPDTLGQAIDLAVMDTSFISITAIIPALLPLFAEHAIRILALIKPQFELPKSRVGKGGVVRDPAFHQEAVDKIAAFAESSGLIFHGAAVSPILGPKGNTEFLTYLTG